MKKLKISVLLPLSLWAFLSSPALLAQEVSASLDIYLDQNGPKVNPLLYGIFFEEINRAGDGGLFAEMLQNRSFEDDAGQARAWTAGQGLEMVLDREKPLHAKNLSSLKLKFLKPGARLSQNGFSREEAHVKANNLNKLKEDFRPAYPGGLVLKKGEAYHFYAHQRGSAALRVILLSSDGKVLAQKVLPPPEKEKWTKVEADLLPSKSDMHGLLVLESMEAGELNIDELSLMPQKTWKGHGMRPDLAEMVAAMKPAFVRFPGGCFVEGSSPQTAARWKDSIGDAAARRGIPNV
jgi:hypothetical protein